LKRGAPHTPSPLLVGNDLYLVSDHGQASCIDAKTGKVHWQNPFPAAIPRRRCTRASMSISERDGTTTVIKASRLTNSSQRIR